MKTEDHESFERMIDESLAGVISAERERSLREHLDGCDSCQAYLGANKRVIAGLRGFSFEVDPGLNAGVVAALRLRGLEAGAWQVGTRQERATPAEPRRWVLASLAALVLTAAGSFVDLQFGGVVAAVFDMQRAQVRQGLFTFWILPSLCVLLLFPVLPWVSKAGAGRRRDLMKRVGRFLKTVPKAVQVCAWIVGFCGLLAGLIVAFETSEHGEELRSMSAYGGAGLVFGVCAAAWLLCLGFVFADARRRDMRPVPWVLVAAFFPHLLGFLLYFVLRHPISGTCGHCGMTVPKLQRFCSWCGAPLAAPGSSDGSLGVNPSREAGQ